jgi:hypothetical protein
MAHKLSLMLTMNIELHYSLSYLKYKQHMSEPLDLTLRLRKLPLKGGENHTPGLHHQF